jgi:hypothetical protein
MRRTKAKTHPHNTNNTNNTNNTSKQYIVHQLAPTTIKFDEDGAMVLLPRFGLLSTAQPTKARVVL